MLITADELFSLFNEQTRKEKDEDFRTDFDTCVTRIESRGLIRRLSFGGYILLQPEVLDCYAASIINAAKEEPAGMGCIREDDVKVGNFFIPEEHRVKNTDEESLLLLATIEGLLCHEIALREPTARGAHLVFPSQYTRENPELPFPKGRSVTFSFEGAVQNIYTTLVVRLAYSDIYRKQDMWKNAVLFTTKTGGDYGIYLKAFDDGRAELILFFNLDSSEEMRFQFEEYVKVHLLRRAIPDTVRRRRMFVCPNCNNTIADYIVHARKDRGYNTIDCQVCEYKGISIIDWEEKLAAISRSVITRIDKSIAAKRDRAAASSILEGKSKTGQFDVFLCHNNKDKKHIRKISDMLKELGIRPWLDEEEIRPGELWTEILQDQIEQVKSAAVFIGKDGVGEWMDLELQAIMRQFVKRRCPVIPVILGHVKKIPKIPPLIDIIQRVDFRKKEPDPLQRLIWGITGEKPSA